MKKRSVYPGWSAHVAKYVAQEWQEGACPPGYDGKAGGVLAAQQIAYLLERCPEPPELSDHAAGFLKTMWNERCEVADTILIKETLNECKAWMTWHSGHLQNKTVPIRTLAMFKRLGLVVQVEDENELHSWRLSALGKAALVYRG